ncbi:MAG: VCBS repeat-containing protein [Fuerstiella sp.]
MPENKTSNRSRLLVAGGVLLLSIVALTVVLFLQPRIDQDSRSQDSRSTSAGRDDMPESTSQQAAAASDADADAVLESEQLSEAASAQLTRVLSLLDSQAQLSIDDLRPLIAENIESTELRSEQFEEQFRTATLVARSGQAALKEMTTGADSFRQHLLALAEPWPGAAHLHSKVKVISVDRESASAMNTSVIVQRSGTVSDGAFQQDAVWNCSWRLAPDDSDAPILTRVILTEYEEAVVTSAAGHLFSDCTESVFRSEPSFQQQLLPGIDFWRSRMQQQHGVHPFGHHGIAVADVNNDGLDDIYAGQPAGLPNRLYRQNEDGTVTDIAQDAGVDLLNRTRGVLLIDADNDGDQDLIVVLEDLIVFLANDGTARFSEMNAVPTTQPGSLSAADFDLDGDLDIYVVNYGDRFRSLPDVYHDANNGGPNMLLRNDGNWNFVDVTGEVGLNTNNSRWSFAASWEDFDDDGDPDLYVANDFGRNNLYRNNNGVFEDVAADFEVEDIAAGMSASWADYDHDGRMDLYVGNMFSSAGLRVTGQSRFQKDATETVRNEFKRHARGNSLFRNTGDGPFEDVSVEAGVTIGRWAWASRFVDINNDSWEDLVVANGFVTGHQTNDL